jgi:beta-lactamase class D
MSPATPTPRFITMLLAAAAALATTAAVAFAETRVIGRTRHADALDGLAVAFLARDLETGTDFVLERSDLDGRHSPFSTFKIPNLLIAIETGVAPSLAAWRDWNPRRRPATSYWPQSWKQGQTLGSAFARSAIWYYQDVALDVGAQAYRERLAAWRYGNADVRDGSDDFWLGSTLRISVREMVDFLQATVEGELDGVSPASLEALHEASRLAEVPGLSFHGKTGTGPDDPADLDGSFSGYFAGYLLRDDRAPVVFALHVAAPDFASLRDFRRAFSVTMLEDAGLVPRGAFAAN